MLNFARKTIRKRGKYVTEDYPQVESRLTHGGSQILIVAGADGWNLKPYECRGGDPEPGWRQGHGDTKGKNIRVSMNAPLNMTWDEWCEVVKEVEACYVEAKKEYTNDRNLRQM
jgi:hypothetical protein